MADEQKADDAPKIIIDSDWKEEASAEKAKLEEEAAAAGSQGPIPEPVLLELINMVAIQASIGLGGYRSPAGETLPPDLAMAKHYIDLIELLKEKTTGNTTDDEVKMFDGVLHELRMQYVQAVSGVPAG